MAAAVVAVAAKASARLNISCEDPCSQNPPAPTFFSFLPNEKISNGRPRREGLRVPRTLLLGLSFPFLPNEMISNGRQMSGGEVTEIYCLEKELDDTFL